MWNNSRIVWIVFSIGMMISCKTTQKGVIVSKDSYQETAQVIGCIQKQSPSFETFSSPFKVQARFNNQKIALSGQLKIRKGEALLLSVKVPFLGMELIRIHCNQERLLCLNRFQKTYLELSLKEIPPSLSWQVWEALLGNRMLFESMVLKEKKGHLQHTSQGYKIDYPLPALKSQLSYLTDKECKINQTSLRSDQQGDWNVDIHYRNFATVGNAATFPSDITIEAAFSSMQAGLDLSFQKIELDQPLDLKTEIPAGYKKIDAKEFLSTLTSLK